MLWHISLITLVIPAFSVALPSPGTPSHVLHEKRSSQSTRWQKTERVHAEAVIPLRIGLTQGNLQTGMDKLMEVSHPTSPKFGQFYSAAEVNEFFRPSNEAVEQVKAWLISEGVDADTIIHSDNKGWLAVDLPVRHVEHLLTTQYFLHEHVDKNLAAVGCDEYSVPAHLKDSIDYIRPGIKLSAPVAKPMTRTKRNAPRNSHPGGPHRMPGHHWPMPPAASGLPEDVRNCGVNITPTCLRALYGIPAGEFATPGLELGLYEQGSYYDTSDVNDFFANFAPWVPRGTVPETVSIDGGEAPIDCTDSSTCGEADIDVDLATALVYPQKVINYQVDDSYYAPGEVALDNTFNTFLDALDGSYCTYEAYGIKGDSPGIDPTYPDPHTGGYKGKLQCGTVTATKVISASYGESEEDFPAAYARRQCNEFMKLGLQGHSIFVSSSDYGVGSPPGDPGNGCLSNVHEGLNGTIFNPDYPSDCPYITSVGATMLPRNGTVKDAELTMYVPDVAPHFSSAGGFSNFYPVPSYQREAVDTYLARYVPDYKFYYANASGTNYGENGGIYARGGRGFPDVAANGAYLNAYAAGELGNWFGTSLASPIFASVITLINEQRAQVGKGPVGFVNPTLYAHPEVFNDIKEGPNPNCGTQGFPAVEGWDPSTGLGTPNYSKMLKLYMSLP